MRSRISPPIADHPTVLDSKNIMAYIAPSITPESWQIKQKVLDSCSPRCIDLIKSEISLLYKYSRDPRIIGYDDYLKIVLPTATAGCILGDEEINTFHTGFVSELKKRIPSEHEISLEYGYPDAREFPTSKGIYFCVRSTNSFSAWVDEVWYIGKTNNFRSRWSSHNKLQALKSIRYVDVYCLPLEDCSDSEISFMEEAYIYMLKPVFNGTSAPDRHLGQDPRR